MKLSMLFVIPLMIFSMINSPITRNLIYKNLQNSSNLSIQKDLRFDINNNKTYYKLIIDKIKK